MSSTDSKVAVAAAVAGGVIGAAFLTVMQQRSQAASIEALRAELLLPRLLQTPGGMIGATAENGEGTKYTREVQTQRSSVSGIAARWTKPVVISPPSLLDLANTIEKRLGSTENSQESPTLVIDRFKSNDPNMRFHWQRVVGRRIVFLFDTVNQDIFFEQLSLLQALQGFAVPDSEDKQSKWKTYVGRGKYAWGRASQITIVIPWYRPCQMERTSRWQLEKDGKWTNGHPEGQWLDVPTAQYMARLLATPGSVPPLPGPNEALDGMPLVPLWRPPLELLFIELHEEAPIVHSVSDLGATVRMERFVPYFLDKFRAKKSYPGKAQMYVLFPDRGAHDRYAESVGNVLKLDEDHILYIKKTRVGDSISQEQKLFYARENAEDGEKTSFEVMDHVLIIDDFTNSGSTLFGAANLAKKITAGGSPSVSIFVSHFVAIYDPKCVEAFQQKLHDLGADCNFYCTNSIPQTTGLLKGDPQVEVVDISDFIADMVESSS